MKGSLPRVQSESHKGGYRIAHKEKAASEETALISLWLLSPTIGEEAYDVPYLLGKGYRFRAGSCCDEERLRKIPEMPFHHPHVEPDLYWIFGVKRRNVAQILQRFDVAPAVC